MELTPIQILLGVITVGLFFASVAFGWASHNATNQAGNWPDTQATAEGKPAPSTKKVFTFGTLSLVCLFGTIIFVLLLGTALKQGW